MTTGKWIVVSVAAGITVYYCEWLEFAYPGNCNQGLMFTLVRMYAIPLAISGALGFFCSRSPLACWLSFMLPSWLVRLVQLAISVAVGSNLSPLLIAIDAGHFLLAGLITGGVARLRRSHIREGNLRPNAASK